MTHLTPAAQSATERSAFDPDAFLRSVAFAKRPMVTQADWRRVSDAKLAIELRKQARIHQGNANSCLSAINALMEQMDGADEARRVAIAAKADHHRQRYDEFVADVRADSAQAERIVERLRAAEEVAMPVQISEAAE